MATTGFEACSCGGISMETLHGYGKQVQYNICSSGISLSTKKLRSHMLTMIVALVQNILLKAVITAQSSI